MMRTALGRLRAIGLAEGLSYLLLLSVAMPLKYLAGEPGPVKVLGWIHGVLFVAFVVALLQVYRERRWPLAKAAGAFVASLLPFGTFVLDRSLRREAAEPAP